MEKKDYLLMGAGLGLLAGYFFNSEQGRAKRSEVADYLKTQNTELKNKGGQLIEKATEVVSDLKNRGNAYLSELNKESIDATDIEQYIEDKVNHFRSKLQNEAKNFVNSNGHTTKA